MSFLTLARHNITLLLSSTKIPPLGSVKQNILVAVLRWLENFYPEIPAEFPGFLEVFLRTPVLRSLKTYLVNYNERSL